MRIDGLRLQLLGLIILPFMILLIVIAFSGVGVHQNAMRRLVAERDERAARAAAAAIGKELQHRQAFTEVVLIALDDASPSQPFLDRFEFMSADFDRGLALLDWEGNVFASFGPSETWLPLIADQVGPDMQEMRAIYLEPQKVKDEPVSFLAIRKNETILVGAFSTQNAMQSTLASLIPNNQTYTAFVVDRAGQLLYAVGFPPAPNDVLEHPGAQAALRGEHGSSYFPQNDAEHVVAFSPIDPSGWALVVEEPWRAVASPTLNLTLAAPLALVPALLITLVGLWFGARQVVRPLQRLEQLAAQLDASKRGSFDDQPVGGIAEIKRLQATLLSMANRIRTAQQALKAYIGEITRAQEEERRRLARELHDTTIQDLIALNQKVQMLRMQPQFESQSLAASLDQLQEQINLSIQDVRRISRGLRPIYLEDLGLIPALEMLALDTQKELGIEVEFELTGDPERLAPEVELDAYRILQEALNNIGRHARASKVEIRLQFTAGRVGLFVVDDGRGFIPPENLNQLTVHGHYGLIGMQERAEAINAALSIDSTPGAGTRIELDLPTGGARQTMG